MWKCFLKNSVSYQGHISQKYEYFIDVFIRSALKNRNLKVLNKIIFEKDQVKNSWGDSYWLSSACLSAGEPAQLCQQLRHFQICNMVGMEFWAPRIKPASIFSSTPPLTGWTGSNLYVYFHVLIDKLIPFIRDVKTRLGCLVDGQQRHVRPEHHMGWNIHSKALQSGFEKWGRCNHSDICPCPWIYLIL